MAINKWCTCHQQTINWLLNNLEVNQPPHICHNRTLEILLKADYRWLNGNSTNCHFSNLSDDSSIRWLLLGKSRRTCKGERMGNKRICPQNILVLYDFIHIYGNWNICQYFLYAKVMRLNGEKEDPVEAWPQASRCLEKMGRWWIQVSQFTHWVLAKEIPQQ